MAIAKVNISDQVFDYIKEQISAGTWLPGDKIPPEVELAERLGVSRMSLRAGIQKANIVGITETRVGEGTFVKEFSIRPFLEVLISTNLVLAETSSIQEMREILQVGSAMIAFRNNCIDENDIRQLEETYAIMEKEIREPDLTQFHKADTNFHRLICKMCHNELIYTVYDGLEYLLMDFLKKNTEASIYHHGNGNTVIQYHKQLLDAICARDLEKFAAISSDAEEIKYIQQLFAK